MSLNTSMSHPGMRCAVFILVAMLLASVVNGQINSGTITGNVTDSTGAGIPGAEVVVTNQDTNVEHRTTTNAAGRYTVPYLAAGSYTVGVSLEGFVPYRQTGLTLATAQTVRADVALVVSAVESVVEVSAQAVQIQTDTSNVSGAVGSGMIDAIPNIVQNPLQYAFLQAGVVPRNATADTTGTNSFGIGVNGRRQYSAVGINGGRAFTNDIQLDGLPVMGGGYNEAAVIPNTEGLQEVRVISNNFSAEYGHGQGVISMSTKSGTNEFHGQVTYMLRNEALNANQASNKANNIARSPFKVNEFGGAIAGPILKDKLFFSSSYHYLRFGHGLSSLLTVPTALERQGDFSETFIRDSNGQPVPAQLFDPFGVSQLNEDLYQRNPIAGAVIPNPDPHAALMYSYYPEPNRTPEDAFNTRNFSSSVVETIRRHSLNNRVDYRIGPHSIYFSGGLGYGKVNRPRDFGEEPFNGAPRITSDNNPYAQIGDTIILSPTLVLDVRYGITRIHTKAFHGDKEGFTDYDAIGVPQNIQGLIQINGAAPVVRPNSYSGGSGGGSNWTALTDGLFGTKLEQQTSHVFNTSITKVSGKWTHKAGFEWRNLLSNYLDLEEASVSLPSLSAIGRNFTFEYVTADGNMSSENRNPVQRGINGASLLVGGGQYWIRPGANLRAAFGQPYLAFYTQNDWRATSKLTINLGLRWDYQPGPTERFDRMSAYDLTAQTPYGTTGGIAFPGAGGHSRGLWDTQYNNWGPRVGAAYQLNESTVIRGGFGITYLPSNTGYFSGPNDYGSSPFGNGTVERPYGDNPHGVPVGTFSDPTQLSVAVGADTSAPSIYGISEARFDRFIKNGRAMQWNVFIEKSLSRTWFASIGYSASNSDYLPNRNIPFQNLQNVSSSVLSGWRNEYIGSNGTLNPANVQVSNPYQPADGSLRPFIGDLGGATLPQFITYLPYPLLYGGGARINDSHGYADYQSLQLRVSHAFASGFQLDANYTWSKSLDYTLTAIEDGQGFNSGGTASAPDLLNLENNRKYGSADVPHRFVGIARYELPFGADKPLNPENSIARALVSGWQVGSVVTIQSGMPFVLSGASDGAMVSRPNRISGVPVEVPEELQRWYDGKTSVTLPCGRVVTPSNNTFLQYSACAFQGQVVVAPNGKYIADQFWVGNSAQTIGTMRGPGRFNIDLSLRRSFSISERMHLELTADATNLLNSSQFSGNYNGSLGGTNLVNDANRGLVPGMGSSDTFGTMGLSTFDPRQVTMRLRLSF